MLGGLRTLLFGPSAAVRVAEARATTARAHAIQARYDNAQTTDENRRQWWAADYFSAKAANNYAVRRVLRTRSRYEVANNPFLFGVVNSNADDLIDTGPTLQVLTKDAAYNREVERSWQEWAAEVALAEKLRTTKLAKTVDGEGFLVLKTVADLEHPVKLYPCDLEADQVTTPAPANAAELWVDGLTLHPVTGRPTAYHVLRHHPGDWYFPELNPLVADKISARHVLHWFGKFRPGQVRGIPTFTSSLDLFAELRAFRRATLGAAEIAADYAAMLTQGEKVGAFPGEGDDAGYAPFKRVPIDRKMMTMLPPGADMKQLKSEHPATTYEMFQEKCLGEACRPLAYPLNLALGTSQKFNFSSAKLDHVNYRGSLRIEREGECNAVVLDPLFREWFYEGLLAGDVRSFDGVKPPPHEWHWPGFEPLDPKVDADADHERLAHGTDTYRAFWARRGRDWRDVMRQQAEERKEIDRLRLEFGDPVKRSETETVRVDDDGNPIEKPAPAKKPKAGEPAEKTAEKSAGEKVVKKALGSADVQNTALNGAQVTALVAVCDKLVMDQYTEAATKEIIQGAFPGMDSDLINTIVKELAAHTPPALEEEREAAIVA